MQKLVDLGHAPQPEPTPILAGGNSIEDLVPEVAGAPSI